MLSSRQSSKHIHGFTLVEMLVVVPIALIVITTLVMLMITLVGDSLAAQNKNELTYRLQDALGRIEQDVRLSTSFSQTYTPSTPAQTRNGSGQAFASASQDIILASYATTKNPQDATRALTYYANQPSPCSGNFKMNKPMSYRTVIFLNNGTLWRRTIVPNWNISNNDANTVCGGVWQRNSCQSGCVSMDEKLIDNVTSYTASYFDNTGAATSNFTEAASVKVSLAASRSVAGESATASGTIQALRLNKYLTPS